MHRYPDDYPITCQFCRRVAPAGAGIIGQYGDVAVHTIACIDRRACVARQSPFAAAFGGAS